MQIVEDEMAMRPQAGNGICSIFQVKFKEGSRIRLALWIPGRALRRRQGFFAQTRGYRTALMGNHYTMHR